MCNMKVDKKNYTKDETVCKSCYNKDGRENHKYTIIQNEIITSHQQSKIENINNNNNNRSLIIGF